MEIRRKSHRVMAIVLTLDREVIQKICANEPQNGRPDREKVRFYQKMASKWDLGRSSQVIISLKHFNGHMWKCAKHLKMCIRRIPIRKEIRKEEDCWSSIIKESCTWQTRSF